MSVSDWVQIGVGGVLSVAALLVFGALVRFAGATRALAAEAERQRLALQEPRIRPHIEKFFSNWQVSLSNTGEGDAYDVQPLILLNRDAGYCESAWARDWNPDREPEQRRGPRWPHIPRDGSEYWELERANRREGLRSCRPI